MLLAATMRSQSLYEVPKRYGIRIEKPEIFNQPESVREFQPDLSFPVKFKVLLVLSYLCSLTGLYFVYLAL